MKNMKKPVIGISGSLIIDSSGSFAGYKRSYVNNDYKNKQLEEVYYLSLIFISFDVIKYIMNCFNNSINNSVMICIMTD